MTPYCVKHALFSDEDILQIDLLRVPEHIAIIMDGNRRWAKNKGLPSMVGHAQGARILLRVAQASRALGVKILTVYAFSTENWLRGSFEVDALMYLFKRTLQDQREAMVDLGIRLCTIGDLTKFPADVLREIEISKQATASCTQLDLILALNYGGRDDICRAAESILHEYAQGFLEHGKITEELFASHLDTAEWKDPDFFIRTSGERRLSNFLLWQLSYAEVYTTDVLWPDFDEKELLKAVIDFQKRDRRCGC